MAHGSTNPKAVIQGAVSDAPSPALDGELKTLSLTNDGRLRVSVLDARVSVPFSPPKEEKMWGSLEAKFTFTGSPWSDW